MRFYYFSLFSWLAWAVYGVIAVALLSSLWTKLLKLKLKHPGYWVLAAVVLIAPWAEELWIAYNFGRLCQKDAGVFISRTMEVDGYYDDTGIVTRLVGRAPYKFIESRDKRRGFRRVERATDVERARALAWYSAQKPGKPAAKGEWIVQPIDDHVHVVVEPDTGYAWRVTILDKPTARYHYKKVDAHTRVSHQITRFENVVVDSQTGDVPGRSVNYYRGPYWFFLSLDQPTIPCTELDGRDVIVDRQVLRPTK